MYSYNIRNVHTYWTISLAVGSKITRIVYEYIRASYLCYVSRGRTK